MCAAMWASKDMHTFIWANTDNFLAVLARKTNAETEGEALGDLSSTDKFTGHFRWCPEEVQGQHSQLGVLLCRRRRRGSWGPSLRARLPTGTTTKYHSALLCMNGALPFLMFCKKHSTSTKYGGSQKYLVQFLLSAAASLLLLCCCRRDHVDIRS